MKRDDVFVWFIYHSESSEDGEDKIKTAGKMIDNVITIEGLFNVILFADAETDNVSKKTKYFFITNADGKHKARSKYGMFDTLQIPNDAGLIVTAINNYNQ